MLTRSDRDRGSAARAAGSPRPRAEEVHESPRIPFDPDLPRGERVRVGTVGTLREILHGPGGRADGTLNLIGALRKSMATCGYTEVKEFQRVEVVVHN